MSLIGCGSIHQGHERFSDHSRGRQEIFMCLAALLDEQFLPIREWRCQDIDQVLLHGDHFVLSSELLDKSDFGATAGKSFTVFFARGGVEFDR